LRTPQAAKVLAALQRSAQATCLCACRLCIWGGPAATFWTPRSFPSFCPLSVSATSLFHRPRWELPATDASELRTGAWRLLTALLGHWPVFLSPTHRWLASRLNCWQVRTLRVLALAWLATVPAAATPWPLPPLRLCQRQLLGLARRLAVPVLPDMLLLPPLPAAEDVAAAPCDGGSESSVIGGPNSALRGTSLVALGI
jgi:hypothetical protein